MATPDAIVDPALRTYRPVRRRVGIPEIWRTREVAFMIGMRDIKAKYKQAALGPLWLIIGPLGMLFALTIAFYGVTSVDTGDTPYLLFALVGLIVWTYLQLSLTMGANAIVGNSPLVRRSAVPRVALVTGTLLGNVPPVLVMFTGTFIATLIMEGAAPQLVLLPVMVVWTLAFTFGMTLLVASIGARFRDIVAVIPLFIQAGVFVTPVGYPLEGAPPNIKTLLELNPLTGMIEVWRWVVLDMPISSTTALVTSLTATACLLAAGWLVFTRLEVRFADVI